MCGALSMAISTNLIDFPKPYRAELAVWDKFVQFRSDNSPAPSILEFSGDLVDD